MLKSTIETLLPVSESALRNARAARRTFSVAFDEAIEPDSSRTRMTSIPQLRGRLGFGAGLVTERASVNTFSALVAPPQGSPLALAVKPAS